MQGEGRNADAIEQDIERTQDAIGDTVEKIEEKLSPNEVTRSILGDDGQEIAREMFAMARENPIPVAMIAIGAVWLVAASDSPLVARIGRRLSAMVTGGSDQLRPRSDEPAPIGPPPPVGERFDRARGDARA